MIKAIIFLGPPASGKGTQAMIIASKLNAEYFRVSKVIQDQFKNFPQDPDVLKARAFYDSGKLIPYQILIKWISIKIEQLLQNRKVVVFDGIFRSLKETKVIFPIFEKYLRLNEMKIFFLNISESTAIKRSALRKICSVCGFPVALSQKTKKITKCPLCNGSLIIRADEEKIHKRLTIYKKETLPVLDFFKKKGILEEINGEATIDEITKCILIKIKNAQLL